MRTVRRVRLTGAIAGIALMGAVDEIVFHQLLQWHHFYVHTTAYWQIFSDGLFHLLTTTLFFAAIMLLWAQRREFATIVSGRTFWIWFLIGAGGFQVFDGVVNHKLLGLHPVRVGVETIWPYDVSWVLSGALLLFAGLALGRGQDEAALRS